MWKNGVWVEISMLMVKLSLDAEDQNSCPFMVGVCGASEWLRCAQQGVQHLQTRCYSKLHNAEGILSDWASESCEPRLVLKKMLRKIVATLLLE